MILLKTVVLFVLANPAEFYPLRPEDVEDYPCGDCLTYISYVPQYWKFEDGQLMNANNAKYPCGQANKNGLKAMKNNNVTETKNTKIVGGSNAAQNEFPWQVGIATGYGKKISCGGSIISSKSILTAAHCIQDVRYVFPLGTGIEWPIIKCLYAVVGEHALNRARMGEQWIRICDVKKHPDYKGKTRKNIEGNTFQDEENLNYDFAVLILCTELLFTEKISPVCLPQKHDNQYDQYDRVVVTASGWGKTGIDNPQSDILKKVDLETLTNTKCFGQYWQRREGHPSKLCAYDFDNDGKKGPCVGDSDGPLVHEETSASGKSFFTLIGVTSYGHTECVKRDYPNIFGRVTEVMDTWLLKDGVIEGETGLHPAGVPPVSGVAQCPPTSKSIDLRKNTKNSRSLKNTGGVTYYHFEKDKKLSRKKAQETCISKYGGQLTSINTQDEYEWIKKQVIDLKMFGQIAIGGQWKDKSSRKFEWTDESEMDMSVLNANWFRTRNYQFPSYKNKKRINLELWYSRRAMGFANALDHKAPTMYICKVAPSCSA